MLHASDCALHGVDTGVRTPQRPDGIFYDGPCDCGEQQPVAAMNDRNYAMNSEPERKRFEQYIRERQPGASYVFHRRPNGPYIDDFTEYQWLAWDYRASLKSQSDVSRDEKLFKFYDWLEDECAIRLDIFEDADSAFKLYAAFEASQKKGA